MDKILLVEDEKSVASKIIDKIKAETNFQVAWASTYSDAVKIIDEENAEFVAGLLNVNLPDAPPGQIIDYAISKNIPSIIFTNKFSDDIIDKYWSKGIADYIQKDDDESMDYIISLINRIH